MSIELFRVLRLQGPSFGNGLIGLLGIKRCKLAFALALPDLTISCRISNHTWTFHLVSASSVHVQLHKAASSIRKVYNNWEPTGGHIKSVVLLHFVPEVAKLRLEFKLFEKKTVFPASQHLILRKRQARLTGPGSLQIQAGDRGNSKKSPILFWVTTLQDWTRWHKHFHTQESPPPRSRSFFLLQRIPHRAYGERLAAPAPAPAACASCLRKLLFLQ